MNDPTLIIFIRLNTVQNTNTNGAPFCYMAKNVNEINMKHLFNIFFATMLIAVSACNSQRLVQSIDDVGKLEKNEREFIGHPLHKLLSQVKPKIMFVHGNPENKSSHQSGGTHLTFYFVSRQVGRERVNASDTPTHVMINFQIEQNNTRKPLPKEGLTRWTKKESKEYGDMIIQNIFVSGKN